MQISVKVTKASCTLILDFEMYMNNKQLLYIMVYICIYSKGQKLFLVGPIYICERSISILSFWEARKYLIVLTYLPIYFKKTNSWKITQAGNGLGSKLRHLSQKNSVLSIWVFSYEYIIFYENMLCIDIN